MNDFEAIIGKMLADGKSVDEIGDAMAAALNEVEKHKKEAEAKTAREKLIDHMKDVFNESVEDGTLDLSDMAAGVTLAYCKDSKCDDLLDTEDKIVKFYDVVRDVLKQVPTTVRTANGISSFFSLFDTAKGKREKQEEKKETSTNKSKESDWERIEKFLKELG